MQYTEQYIENDVLNLHPVELVCLLYAKAIEKLGQAAACGEAGDMPGRTRALGRVIQIVLELQGALDTERGAEVAAGLEALYAYLLVRLSEAITQGQSEPLEEARQLLETLYEGWQQCRLQQAAAFAAPQTPVTAEATRSWTL